GINNAKPAVTSFLTNFGRYSVGTENGDGAVGNFVETLNEDCSLSRQLIDHESVVNDFFANVDRSSQLLQCECNDVDRPDHAGTEPSRFRQQDSLLLSINHHDSPQIPNMLTQADWDPILIVLK